jgi:hypothetical protein
LASNGLDHLNLSEEEDDDDGVKALAVDRSNASSRDGFLAILIAVDRRFDCGVFIRVVDRGGIDVTLQHCARLQRSRQNVNTFGPCREIVDAPNSSKRERARTQGHPSQKNKTRGGNQ